MNVAVLYSCPSCHLTKVTVLVPARGNEDVVTWMKATTQHIANDHQQRSPTCPSRTCDIMIPMTGTDKVGGPVIQ